MALPRGWYVDPWWQYCMFFPQETSPADLSSFALTLPQIPCLFPCSILEISHLGASSSNVGWPSWGLPPSAVGHRIERQNIRYTNILCPQALYRLRLPKEKYPTNITANSLWQYCAFWGYILLYPQQCSPWAQWITSQPRTQILHLASIGLELSK